MASDAVGSERVSKITGYKITKGDFSESSPNLPQRLLVIGEANNANQATLNTDKWTFTTLQKVGERYGYGSPIHLMMRILKGSNSPLGGIPVDIIPQEEAAGATSKQIEITLTGTATGNGTHFVKVAGRNQIDGASYAININTGDTGADIYAKIEDAVNNALSSPVTATSDEYSAVVETKWKGLTAEELSIEIDTNDKDLGIEYTVTSLASGSGTPTVTSALNQIGSIWNTLVVNGYGAVDAIMDELEAFNGVADPDTPTGRYAATVMKPFVAITGSIADDPSSITSLRRDEMTISIAPAPLSSGFSFEAAANMAALRARVSQDTPHLDVTGKTYFDMPTPTSIGSMDDQNERDRIVKLGCSTVLLKSGKYEIVDSVTTYRPEGEEPPQYRHVRSLVQDQNIYYGYYLLELSNVVDHAIANDNDVVTASKVVKPKQWKAVLSKYFESLVERALIVDAPFSKNSLEVGISTTNPDRFETFFRYKRSGYARVVSTTAEAGFNFGTIE